MARINRKVIKISLMLLVFFCLTAAETASQTRARNACEANSPLNGIYRIDVERSDQLYSVIEGATSNVPYGEQQLFFTDLAIRLTPPDLLVIECRDNRVSLASSRAPRMEFVADGVVRNSRNSSGRTVKSRIAFEKNGLTFTSHGGSDDNLSFTFTPLENGKSLQVTRRISAQELIEPVVIQTVYNKISEVARWDVFDDSQLARQNRQPDSQTSVANTPNRRTVKKENTEVEILRAALNQWIDATNSRDIDKQMSFYMPQLKAFYLARNASLSLVRAEKNRAFTTATSIDVRAAEPEIIFQDSGRTAVMRFRKKYNIVNGSKSRRGEVVQELRWQQTNNGWKIFSERDIKVIS